MKRFLLAIALSLIVMVGVAQTTVTSVVQPNLDTAVTTATTVIHPYKPPVPTYIASGQIYRNGQSNITISGYVINIQNGGAIAILLQNCKYVHITNCIIENSTNDGIQLTGCTGVEIDHCFITNVKAGINAMYSVTVNAHDNQFLNMNGPFPSGNFIQFDNVNGAGNRIMDNRCEDIAGVAQHPQDGLSVYQSNGLPGDSIMVTGNWIRGGQIINDSGGGAAIVLGDVGGSYQVARNNIVVNGGFVGMQIQGGSHIKMDHNLIYGVQTPYSNCGLCFGNYSGKAVSDIYIAYNKVKYFNKYGYESDEWYDPKAGLVPAGWSTNIIKASIDATILPATIITMK